MPPRFFGVDRQSGLDRRVVLSDSVLSGGPFGPFLLPGLRPGECFYES